MLASADDIEDILDASAFLTFSDLFNIPVAWVALLLVRRISHLQERAELLLTTGIVED